MRLHAMKSGRAMLPVRALALQAMVETIAVNWRGRRRPHDGPQTGATPPAANSTNTTAVVILPSTL